MQIGDLAAQARTHLKSGEVGKARLLASQALVLAPQDARAHHAMALVEAYDQRHERARRHCEAAVAARPDDAFYRTNLAYELIVAGEFDAAREELQRALALDPANPDAYQHLVWITKISPGDPIVDRLERLKQAPGIDARSFAYYAYALGKCYDDIGEFDRAFENYKAANDRLDGGYDRDKTRRLFDEIKRVWSREFLETRRGLGFHSDKPVFIVGMMRSGSTLLEQRLSARPDVVALGERNEIPRMVNSIQANHPARAPYPAWAVDLPKDAFSGFGRLYLEGASGDHAHVVRAIDKQLINFLYVGFVRAMLPDALVIESRRNPVDNCLSIYFSNLVGRHEYSHDLSNLGFHYRLYADLMAHWRGLDARIVTVDYEPFVDDPAGKAAELWRTMGLANAPVDGGQSSSAVATFSAFQARQNVYKSSVARWKNYEKHLDPLTESLGGLAG